MPGAYQTSRTRGKRGIGGVTGIRRERTGWRPGRRPWGWPKNRDAPLGGLHELKMALNFLDQMPINIMADELTAPTISLD
jgi:hypothetical protein